MFILITLLAGCIGAEHICVGNIAKDSVCNWEAVYKNTGTFSEVFMIDKNNLICHSMGNWTNSKAPCEIDPLNMGGVREVLATECSLQLQNKSKIICKAQMKWENKDYIDRLRVLSQKLECDCHKDNILPGSCRWVISLEFKPGQQDMSGVGILICTLLFIIVTSCIICMGDGGFTTGFVLGSISSWEWDDDDCITFGFGET